MFVFLATRELFLTVNFCRFTVYLCGQYAIELDAIFQISHYPTAKRMV